MLKIYLKHRSLDARYEDGDEDDNPSSSLNLSLVSSSALALNSSTESIRANGERISPNRQGYAYENL
jgi:hypothetical protein